MIGTAIIFSTTVAAASALVMHDRDGFALVVLVLGFFAFIVVGPSEESKK